MMANPIGMMRRAQYLPLDPLLDAELLTYCSGKVRDAVQFESLTLSITYSNLHTGVVTLLVVPFMLRAVALEQVRFTLLKQRFGLIFGSPHAICHCICPSEPLKVAFTHCTAIGWYVQLFDPPMQIICGSGG
jgi:hypothetical protein